MIAGVRVLRVIMVATTHAVIAIILVSYRYFCMLSVVIFCELDMLVARLVARLTDTLICYGLLRIG